MDIAEQMIRTDVVALCNAVESWSGGDCNGEAEGEPPYSQNPAEAAASCTIIENWDGLWDVDSVGTSVWKEFWTRLESTSDLWAVPFDATDPVNTPNTLNDENDAVVEAVLCAIGGAVDHLVAAEIPLDRPWGETQFRWNGDDTQQIPIHGGGAGSGIRNPPTFSIITSDLVDGEGYSDIPAGNSYIHTVTWDDSECPDAFAVLTYSQSSDPASPHYSDMTEVYSAGGWNDMPFCPADIEAEKISETQVSTN
jgi:acyl-homoserine-lactone acylase